MIEAVEKVEKKFLQSKQQLGKLIVKDTDFIEAVPIDEIIFLKADGAYTTVHTTNKKLTSSKNIKHFELLLENSFFLRVHKSYLVNMQHFDRFDKSLQVVKLRNDHAIPVSIRKREFLFQYLKSNLI